MDSVITKAAAKADEALIVQSVQSCSTMEKMEARKGIELDLDELCDVQVAHLRDNFGCFVNVAASRDAAAVDGAPAESLPSGFASIAQTQQERALPVPPQSERYDHRLFQG